MSSVWMRLAHFTSSVPCTNGAARATSAVVQLFITIYHLGGQDVDSPACFLRSLPTSERAPYYLVEGSTERVVGHRRASLSPSRFYAIVRHLYYHHHHRSNPRVGRLDCECDVVPIYRLQSAPHSLEPRPPNSAPAPLENGRFSRHSQTDMPTTTDRVRGSGGEDHCARGRSAHVF